MAKASPQLAIPIRDENLRRWLKMCVTKLIRNLNPVKVILFGSHAHRTASDESDVDLLVVLDTEEESMSKRYSLVSPFFEPRQVPMDILVMRKSDYDARALNPYDSFMHELLSEGLVLYER